MLPGSLRRRSMSIGPGAARSISGIYARLAISTFLALVAIVPQLPFLAGLGFYGDDWVFLSTFDRSAGDSPARLFEAVFGAQPWARVRPAQLAYLSLLYWMFGDHPLGYHVSNLTVFACVVVLFYLVLRTLKQPGAVCLAAPLIYAVLPHYSTDRFWIAASQANLSILGLMLNLYAGLRMQRSRYLAAIVSWGAVSVVALLLSGLAYEVAVPLFLVNLVLIWRWSNRGLPTLMLIGALVAALGAIVILKFVVSDRTAVDGAWMWRAARIFYGSTRVNLLEYGLFLPYVFWTIFRNYALPSVLVMAAAVGWSAMARLSVADVRPVPGTPVRYWTRLFAVGVCVYALGYAVFLATNEMGFSTTGMVNRTAIAAALGMAMMLTAGAALVRGGRYFAPIIAVICFAGVLMNGTVASMWTAAAAKQQQVLSRVQTSFPALPPRTTVLLDGLCANIGPAPVFESAWDFGAALRLAYRDPTLAGDVLSPATEADAAGVYNVIYGETNRHAYSDRLLVLDSHSGHVSRLDAQPIAAAYLAQLADRWSCPVSQESKGVEVFSWQQWGGLQAALKKGYGRLSSRSRPSTE